MIPGTIFMSFPPSIVSKIKPKLTKQIHPIQIKCQIAQNWSNSPFIRGMNFNNFERLYQKIAEKEMECKDSVSCFFRDLGIIFLDIATFVTIGPDQDNLGNESCMCTCTCVGRKNTNTIEKPSERKPKGEEIDINLINHTKCKICANLINHIAQEKNFTNFSFHRLDSNDGGSILEIYSCRRKIFKNFSDDFTHFDMMCNKLLYE